MARKPYGKIPDALKRPIGPNEDWAEAMAERLGAMQEVFGIEEGQDPQNLLLALRLGQCVFGDDVFGQKNPLGKNNRGWSDSEKAALVAEVDRLKAEGMTLTEALDHLADGGELSRGANAETLRKYYFRFRREIPQMLARALLDYRPPPKKEAPPWSPLMRLADELDPPEEEKGDNPPSK
jgi:hypothetical protein